MLVRRHDDRLPTHDLELRRTRSAPPRRRATLRAAAKRRRHAGTPVRWNEQRTPASRVDAGVASTRPDRLRVRDQSGSPVRLAAHRPRNGDRRLVRDRQIYVSPGNGLVRHSFARRPTSPDRHGARRRPAADPGFRRRLRGQPAQARDPHGSFYEDQLPPSRRRHASARPDRSARSRTVRPIQRTRLGRLTGRVCRARRGRLAATASCSGMSLWNHVAPTDDAAKGRAARRMRHLRPGSPSIAIGGSRATWTMTSYRTARRPLASSIIACIEMTLTSLRSGIDVASLAGDGRVLAFAPNRICRRMPPSRVAPGLGISRGRATRA